VAGGGSAAVTAANGAGGRHGERQGIGRCTRRRSEGLYNRGLAYFATKGGEHSVVRRAGERTAVGPAVRRVPVWPAGVAHDRRATRGGGLRGGLGARDGLRKARAGAGAEEAGGPRRGLARGVPEIFRLALFD
jgi:hypothetical protein